MRVALLVACAVLALAALVAAYPQYSCVGRFHSCSFCFI
jgi:hypothetical protein